MRLGAWDCELRNDTLARDAYGKDRIGERHRHRYEFNGAYREVLQSNGLVVAGVCPRNDLVEIVELAGHPWFVACQFHPEFRSRPLAAHPLFREFVTSTVTRRDAVSEAPPDA
jgi:CTP synthase